MANVSRLYGFRPVKYLNGAPYNGASNVYTAPASYGTALYVGQPVKLTGTASTDGTKSEVNVCAAGDATVGIIVGFGVNRDNLNIDGQYRAASTLRDVYVADDPNIIFEVETSNGTPAAADVGQNADFALGTPVTSTAKSGVYLDMGTKNTTATLVFKILAFSSRVDNEVGASAKLLVKINNHQFGSATGTAGV